MLVIESMPMVLTKSPNPVISSERIGGASERLDSSRKARIMKARYSGGPKESAACPRRGAKS